MENKSNTPRKQGTMQCTCHKYTMHACMAWTTSATWYSTRVLPGGSKRSTSRLEDFGVRFSTAKRRAMPCTPRYVGHPLCNEQRRRKCNNVRWNWPACTGCEQQVHAGSTSTDLCRERVCTSKVSLCVATGPLVFAKGGELLRWFQCS